MKPEVIIEVRVHDDKPDFKWLVFLCGFVLPAMQDSYSHSGGKPIESLAVVSTKTQYSTKILEMWSEYQYCLVGDLPEQINCNQFKKNTSVLILHCLRKNAAPLYRYCTKLYKGEYFEPELWYVYRSLPNKILPDDNS